MGERSVGENEIERELGPVSRFCSSSPGFTLEMSAGTLELYLDLTPDKLNLNLRGWNLASIFVAIVFLFRFVPKGILT